MRAKKYCLVRTWPGRGTGMTRHGNGTDIGGLPNLRGYAHAPTLLVLFQSVISNMGSELPVGGENQIFGEAKIRFFGNENPNLDAKIRFGK